MALSDIILNKGEVILILSDSTQGIVPNGVALNFGTIQSVNDLCDSVIVGDSVWFNIEDAIPFMIISGQTFYRIKEEKISAKETIAP